MSKRKIYWKLATVNDTYGLYFEEGNKNFIPSEENFSKGILIEYLTEDKKADFNQQVWNEMKQLGPDWLEVMPSMYEITGYDKCGNKILIDNAIGHTEQEAENEIKQKRKDHPNFSDLVKFETVKTRELDGIILNYVRNQLYK